MHIAHSTKVQKYKSTKVQKYQKKYSEYVNFTKIPREHPNIAKI